MKIKTLISTVIVACAFASTNVFADKVKIGVANEPYPPFSSLDASGKWVGWEIEIIEAICKAAELDCENKYVAWDGIIPSLTGGQIDVIMSSMSITEERSKTIDFTDHYYKTPAVIAADKNLDVKPTAESLKGKVLGVQASTIHQAYANKYFGDAEIKVYQTQDEANQDLASGRIDATQADSIALADFVASDAGKCCEIKGEVEDDPAILGKGAGAGVRKEDTELKEKLNAAIAKILEDGTHEEITKKYFKSSIYSK